MRRTFGLAGWKIYVDEDDDWEWAPDEPFDVTDADGNYEIMGVRAGLHTVAEVAQDGWLQTFPPAGTHGVFLDAASAGGMVVTGLDFRNQELDERQSQWRSSSSRTLTATRRRTTTSRH